jgi:hypothetical protein
VSPKPLFIYLPGHLKKCSFFAKSAKQLSSTAIFELLHSLEAFVYLPSRTAKLEKSQFLTFFEILAYF